MSGTSIEIPGVRPGIGTPGWSPPAARPLLEDAAEPQARAGAIVTVIRATAPQRVQKVFSLEPDGRLTKRAVATIRSGTAMSVDLADLSDLADLLVELSEKPNTCLVLGGFRGAPAVGTFDVVSRSTLQRIFPWRSGGALAGVHHVPGGRVAARLAAGIDQSDFLLFDADNWPGMPTEWAAMTLAERLAFLAPIVPGLDACARVESRSSTARVVAPGGQPGAASHGWLQVSDPARVPALRKHVLRAMVARGLAQPMAKVARDGSNRVVAREWRTVFDLAVWNPGRLIFTAPPDADAAPGHIVVAAGVRVVNEGAGPLDLGWLRDDRPAMARGWLPDTPDADPAPMEWTDEAPPPATAERVPTPRGQSKPRTLPDPSAVIVGTGVRHNTMFDYARFKAYAWADVRGTPEVPFSAAIGWCREASDAMPEPLPDQELEQTARGITAWMPEHYTPGGRMQGPPKSDAEILANRRAGQRQGCATKIAGSVAAIRAAIRAIEAEGGKASKSAVAARAGLKWDTVAKHWEAATSLPVSHPPTSPAEAAHGGANGSAGGGTARPQQGPPNSPFESTHNGGGCAGAVRAPLSPPRPPARRAAPPPQPARVTPQPRAPRSDLRPILVRPPWLARDPGGGRASARGAEPAWCADPDDEDWLALDRWAFGGRA